MFKIQIKQPRLYITHRPKKKKKKNKQPPPSKKKQPNPKSVTKSRARWERALSRGCSCQTAPASAFGSASCQENWTSHLHLTCNIRSCADTLYLSCSPLPWRSFQSDFKAQPELLGRTTDHGRHLTARPREYAGGCALLSQAVKIRPHARMGESSSCTPTTIKWHQTRPVWIPELSLSAWLFFFLFFFFPLRAGVTL